MKARSAFISDVHLGHKGAQAVALHTFLTTLTVDYLFLVGDILDLVRLARRWYWPPVYTKLVHTVLGLVQQGTQVYYIPGNHDDALRAYEGVTVGGIHITRQHIHRLADGRWLLVLHGDEHGYFQRPTRGWRWWAARGYNALAWLDGHSGTLTHYARAHSRRLQLALKTHRFLLSTYGHDAGCDAVLSGHVHTPEILWETNCLYCNTGDWIQNRTVILEAPDGTLYIHTPKEVL